MVDADRARAESLRLPLRRAGDAASPAQRWLVPAAWCALAAGLFVAAVPLRVPLVARLVGAAIAVVSVAYAAVTRARGRNPTGGWIVVDAGGLSRERMTGAVRLAAWGERFGVAVLSNEAKSHGLLAITTEEQSRYVPVRVAGTDDVSAAQALFARTPTILDADAAACRLERDEALSAEDAARLVGIVRARDAAAIGRILLSDPRGLPVALEGTELRAGGRIIDLASPLEWRSFLFLESAGPLGAVVQATWVRQAAAEVVLVASQGDTRDVIPRGTRASSIPDAPPPHELRVAIDRLYMPSLRHALDRAPRVPRSPAPSVRREGRAPTT